MQLEEARWQSSTFENWIFVGNCLHFIAETKLDVSALDVCESHINMLPFQGGGGREGGEQEIFSTAARGSEGAKSDISSRKEAESSAEDQVLSALNNASFNDKRASPSTLAKYQVWREL